MISVDTARLPCPIAELDLPAQLRLLVLAPLPDDFDSIGVTMTYFFQNGHELKLGVLYTGSGIENSYQPDLTPEKKAQLREQEQRQSLRFFGLLEDCLTFLHVENNANGQPVDSDENFNIIFEFMQDTDPDICFLPHGNDPNTGHQVIFSFFCRAKNLPGKPVTAFLNRDPKTIDMRTDTFMPFDAEQAEWKARLLRIHDSQHQRNLYSRGHGFDDRILNTNRQTARELSITQEFAEAFEIKT